MTDSAGTGWGVPSLGFLNSPEHAEALESDVRATAMRGGMVAVWGQFGPRSRDGRAEVIESDGRAASDEQHRRAMLLVVGSEQS